MAASASTDRTPLSFRMALTRRLGRRNMEPILMSSGRRGGVDSPGGGLIDCISHNF